jgi:Icc-related predicted phosphoesterase
MLIPVKVNNVVKQIKAFSDTHGKHRELQFDYKNIDILVCAGDICEAGNCAQIKDFFVWFGAQPVKYKLFMSGNHDLPFEFFPEYAIQYIPKGVIYLENGGVVIDSIQFYAPPVTMLNTLDVPIHVDVLVTHYPPIGILDGNGWGSDYSLVLANEIKPKVHIFGHAHECGQEQVFIDKTLYCNVSVKN